MSNYRMSGKQFTSFVAGIKAAAKKATLMEELAAAVAYQARFYGNFDAIGRAKGVIPAYASQWFDALGATLRQDHETSGVWKDSGITADEMDEQVERYVSIVMELFDEREKERQEKKKAKEQEEIKTKQTRCLLVRGEEEISVTAEEMAELARHLQKLRDGSLGVKGNVLKEGDALKAA